MPRLTEADLRGALDVLHEAGEVEGTIPFPEPVLDALRRLVPCDVVAYHERMESHDVVVWVGEPRAAVTPEVREASRRYRSVEPLTPADGARLYSDFMTARQFHRTGLYREVARPLGVEDMMRLWLDPRGAGDARLEFDRPDRHFRDSNRVALDALLPYLAQFRRNAVARRRSFSSPANGAERLSPREREVLGLVAQGLTNIQVARTLWISPGTVRKHLEHVYEKLDVHTRTGAIAAVFTLDRSAG
jgi:DNA-binding CsgD family transcriptional regulator